VFVVENVSLNEKQTNTCDRKGRKEEYLFGSRFLIIMSGLEGHHSIYCIFPHTELTFTSLSPHV
jgi:hypothetical protein